MKLIKDNVVREILGEDTIKVFLDAGWKEYKLAKEEKKIFEPKEEIKEIKKKK